MAEAVGVKTLEFSGCPRRMSPCTVRGWGCGEPSLPPLQFDSYNHGSGFGLWAPNALASPEDSGKAPNPPCSPRSSLLQ